MSEMYHSGRLLALAAFLFCTSATLSILLSDVMSGTTPFGLKHWLTIVVLSGTILFGHLAKKAGWLSLSKYGFATLFVVGTGLVAYSSIGRQGEQMTISFEQAKDIVKERDVAEKQVKSNQAMLDEANAKLGKCKSNACVTRVERTIAVYTAAITGSQAILKQVGPPKPVTPEADKLAEAMAYFGYEDKKVKAIAVLLYPFASFAFYEFGSIVSLGFVLGGGRRRKAKGLQPQPQPTVVQKSGEEPSQELAKTPIVPQPIVPSKDASQTSFPEPSPRDFPALRAAGLLSEDKCPPRKLN